MLKAAENNVFSNHGS